MAKKEQDKINLGKIFTVILVVAVALFVCYVLFTFAKIRAKGNEALREAKDIKFALQAVDVEYYSFESDIYNAEAPDGFEDGVKDKVNQTASFSGDNYELTGYNLRKREITGLRFQYGKFLITYKSNSSGDYWSVDYLFNILSANESGD